MARRLGGKKPTPVRPGKPTKLPKQTLQVKTNLPTSKMPSGLMPGVGQPPQVLAQGMQPYQGIPSYKKGGTVKKTGLAYVHKGEKVIPRLRRVKGS